MKDDSKELLNTLGIVTTAVGVVSIVYSATGGSTSAASGNDPFQSSGESSAQIHGEDIKNGTALTTIVAVGGAIADSSSGNQIVLHVFTENNLPYDVVEERAKRTYDELDKSHKPTVNGGATLLSESPEAASLLGEIFGCKSKEEIKTGLDIMKKVYQKLPDNRR